MFRVFILISLLFLTTQTSGQPRQVKVFVAADMPTINNVNGSYAELATALKRARKLNEPTFFLFGGGSLGPSPMSAFDRGAHIIDILNMIEPDVMTITKREFSYFENELSLRSYEAGFPFVASNLSFAHSYKDFGGLHHNVVIEKSGIRLGIISVIDQSVISEYLLNQVIVDDPLTAIELNARELHKQKVDAVILLYSHDIPEVSQLLEKNVIDIAILSNSQLKTSSLTATNIHPNNIYHNQDGSFIEIDLQIATNKVQKPSVSWQEKKLLDFPPDSAINLHINTYSNRLNRLLGEKIGTIKSPADTRTEVVRSKESAFANFITDSLKDFFKTDVAIINGGAIRGERIYHANDILTRQDITEELPFRARIAVIEVLGSDLKQIIEHGLSQVEFRRGRFLHFSGAKITFDSTAPANERLRSLMIDNKPVQADKTYSIATTDYLALGGDGFSMLKDKNKKALNMRVPPLLLDVIINTIRSKREINPQLATRLVDISEETN